jgi:hypothetical protein
MLTAKSLIAGRESRIVDAAGSEVAQFPLVSVYGMSPRSLMVARASASFLGYEKGSPPVQKTYSASGYFANPRILETMVSSESASLEWLLLLIWQ